MVEKIAKNSIKLNKRKKSQEINNNHNQNNIINNNNYERTSIKSISIIFIFITALCFCLLSILIPYHFIKNPNSQSQSSSTINGAGGGSTFKIGLNYANFLQRLLKKLDRQKILGYFYSYYVYFGTKKNELGNNDHVLEREQCFKTCKLEIVESIPENVTLSFEVSESDKTGGQKILDNETEHENHQQQQLSITTFDAWKRLINLAKKDLDIAAYKSSLRGKHVIDTVNSPSTAWGEEIFERLLSLKQENKVRIRMVENYPPRDRGDNEDGLSLERRGVIDRRPLHYKKIFGTPGAMHSKFLLADDLHFYLGSANFDWRSLNQKLEIGVLVLDCPCLAKDVRSIFDTYWTLTKLFNATTGSGNKNLAPGGPPSAPRKDIWKVAKVAPTWINMRRPLKILHEGVPTSVYLASSPIEINGEGRTWDLEAILSVINNAKEYIYINVMDYVPMFLYRDPKKYWPVIDDAIRRAVIERRIELKMIVAALHYVPENLYFLQSLQALNGMMPKNGGRSGVEIKIFHVPVMTEFQTMIARDRRTHRKFMVTEDTVVIGTSNWSGDYFTTTTGVQMIIQQQQNSTVDHRRPFIQKLRKIFERDWTSPYAHNLSTYIQTCVENLHISDTERTRNMCQPVRK